MHWRDKLLRAGATFVQTALAVVVAAGANWVDPAVWQGAAIAGGAALISFVYRTAQEYLVAEPDDGA